jgi:RNA polymerase sigma-70 factor (ECF subfamily)
VVAIGRGDEQTLQAFYDQTSRIVFTLAMRITEDSQTAEEVTLDVFHDVWRKAEKYDPERGPVIGWLLSITRSRALDRLRFEQRKKRTSVHALPFSPNDTADPQSSIQSVERRTLLLRAIQTLTPDERTAVETAYFSELTYEQTAERLNWPIGTVKTRIRSALYKLRNALGAELRDP